MSRDTGDAAGFCAGLGGRDSQTQYFGPGTRLLVLGECGRAGTVSGGSPGAVLPAAALTFGAGSRLAVPGECPRARQPAAGRDGRRRAQGGRTPHPVPSLRWSPALGPRRGAAGRCGGVCVRGSSSVVL